MAFSNSENRVRQRTKLSSHSHESLNQRNYRDSDIFKTNKNNSLPEFTLTFIGIFYALTYLISSYCHNYLPQRPMHFQRDSHMFNEIRAYNILNELSNIGPRPTGSYENEILAVQYLTSQIKHIQNSALDSVHKIDFELQTTNGSFSFNFMDGMTSCYENVKNLIVKIGPRVPLNKKALLINCHFDSVPTSPGSSDDIINCAIMLEVLTVLSHQTTPLQHNVIFLFNGAEENILQGSHGFITQHPWAKEVSAFINLEACGAGGREMLFQADKKHSWLLNAYAASAKYPYGSILAQEIFQSGLIPSDTDFRIFRDFGNLPGLDFAFASNGYVYHTRFDNPKFVTTGTVLRAGENLLGLVLELIKSPFLEHPENYVSTQYVYFDFLGSFMVMFSETTGKVIAYLAVGITVLDIVLRMRKNAKKDDRSFGKEIKRLLIDFGLILLGLILMVFTNVLVALLMTLFKANMVWFYHQGFILGLYIAPTLATLLVFHSCIAAHRRKSSHEDDYQREERFFDALRFFWVLLSSLPLLGVPVKSTYVFSLFLIFPTLIRGLGSLFLSSKNKKGPRYNVPVLVMLMQVIPLLLGLYLTLLMINAFLPIMGRIGSSINSDIIIGVLVSILTFLNITYSLSLIQVVTKVRRTVFMLLFVFCICIFAAVFTDAGFPYSDDPSSPALQRFFFLHVKRDFYNKSGHLVSSDSGYWTAPVDYVETQYLKPFIPEINKNNVVDCGDDLYCGMPYYLPVATKLRHSYYLPSPSPIVAHPHHIRLVNQINLIPSNTKRLSFQLQGSTHVGIVIFPHPDVKLIKWSMGNGKPYAGPESNGRPTYFIYIARVEPVHSWTFWLDIKISPNYPDDKAYLDMVFVNHFIHGHNQITGNFTKFLARLPSWTHTIPWTALYERHQF